MNIKDKIKKAKKLKKVTWKVLAEEYEINFDSLKNWYMGRFKPDVDSMKKLDKLFDEVGIK